MGISARNKAFACWGIAEGNVFFFALLPPKMPPEMGHANEPSRIETEAQKTKNPLGYRPCGLLRTSLEVFMVPRAGFVFDEKSQIFKRVFECMTLQNQHKDQHKKSLDLS